MAKTNETNQISTNPTGSILYRVNYQHVTAKSQLRGGTVCVEATNPTEANEKALGLLKDYGLQNYKLTSTKPY